MADSRSCTTYPDAITAKQVSQFAIWNILVSNLEPGVGVAETAGFIGKFCGNGIACCDGKTRF
jgi:hypothetical protein